jgi:hypothetical protein
MRRMGTRDRIKRKKLERHGRMRGGERYGITLTQADLLAMCDQIRLATGQFVARQSNRVTVWIVEHSGKHLPVVYDGQRQVIVTILPLTAACMEPYRHEWDGVEDGDYSEGAGE